MKTMQTIVHPFADEAAAAPREVEKPEVQEMRTLLRKIGVAGENFTARTDEHPLIVMVADEPQYYWCPCQRPTPLDVWTDDGEVCDCGGIIRQYDDAAGDAK